MKKAFKKAYEDKATNLAHLNPQPAPSPGHTFDNGALLLAIKRESDMRTWFSVLCWWEQNQEYVVWSLNTESGLFYFGDYFEEFKDAAEAFNTK